MKGTMCIFFSRVVTHDCLPASLPSFKRKLKNHFEKSLGEFMVYGEHFQFWNSEEMLLNKLGVDVLLLMLCRLRFCKSFQSDYYVSYDLNNSALDFLI